MAARLWIVAFRCPRSISPRCVRVRPDFLASVACDRPFASRIRRTARPTGDTSPSVKKKKNTVSPVRTHARWGSHRNIPPVPGQDLTTIRTTVRIVIMSDMHNHRSQRLQQLITSWRDRADVAEAEFGATAGAAAFRTAAKELEAWDRYASTEMVSVAEAAVVTGYSRSHIRRLARQGLVSSSRHCGRIQLRLATLPTKARSAPQHPTRPQDIQGRVERLLS